MQPTLQWITCLINITNTLDDNAVTTTQPVTTFTIGGDKSGKLYLPMKRIREDDSQRQNDDDEPYNTEFNGICKWRIVCVQKLVIKYS